MSLKRNEKRTVLILLVACLLVAAGFGVFKVVEARNEQADVASKNEMKKTWSLGDTAAFDGDEEDAALLPSGASYSAGFSWSGKLEVTVESCELYRGFTATGLPESGYTGPADKDAIQFVVCKVRMRNVDAVSGDEQRPNRFNISFLRGMDPVSSEISYFDGTPVDADPDGSEALFFDLAQGEEREYTLGFMLDEAPKTADGLKLRAYVDGASGWDKYTFKFDAVDRR